MKLKNLIKKGNDYYFIPFEVLVDKSFLIVVN